MYQLPLGNQVQDLQIIQRPKEVAQVSTGYFELNFEKYIEAEETHVNLEQTPSEAVYSDDTPTRGLFDDFEEWDSTVVKVNEKEYNNILDVKHRLSQIVNTIYEKDPQQYLYAEIMGRERNIPKEILIEDKCFYVLDKPYLKELYGDSIDGVDLDIGASKSSLWYGRYMHPVYDVMGRISGFTGYDKFDLNNKYMASSNLGYRTRNYLFGLHKYEDILRKGYCILVEGVYDYYRIRALGLPVLGILGLSLSKKHHFLLSQLDFVISIPDRDSAGIGSHDRLRALHPRNNIVVIGKKDIDDELNPNKNPRANHEKFVGFINEICSNSRRGIVRKYFYRESA